MGKKIAIIVILIAVLLVAFFVIESRKKDSVPVDVPTEQVEIVSPEQGPSPFEHDMDGDGISDEEEEALGTSDFDYDTDGDGLSDKMEIDHWKTDPTNTDTDGDGFPDGYEVLNGYNPAGAGKLL